MPSDGTARSPVVQGAPTAGSSAAPSATGSPAREPTVAQRLLPGGVRVFGTIVNARGDAPAREGGHCEAGIVPFVGRSDECRVVIECEGNVLYGAPLRHPVTCHLSADGALTSVTDPLASARDGDAQLELSMSDSTVKVSDERPGEFGRYALEFHVDSIELAP